MSDLSQQTAQELGAALHLRGQRAWNARVDELVRRADALEAAEKERDEARRGREQYGRMATEYRNRVKGGCKETDAE